MTYNPESVIAAYKRGFADGRKSVGQPSLATEQCVGGGNLPVPGSVKTFTTGHPGRGCCQVCGVEFKLTCAGLVRQHRRKKS